MSSKPSVIIFAGLHSGARPLTSYLVNNDLVSFVRIVDKYSVAPPTTYIGAEFPRILENPIVNYQQANLTKEGPVTKVFDPPEGVEPFSYVFDFTGTLQTHLSVELHIEGTAVPAFLIGREASKRKVKAYVRVTPPYYDTSLDKSTAHDETENVKPTDPIGTWYHESLRILANIEDLPLVILRHGLIYGPWIMGRVTCMILMGPVYKELKEEFKSLWSSGVRANTVHAEDVAGACWTAAEWMSKLGRQEANKIAGENIYFANDKSKFGQVLGMPDPKSKLTAPLFNVVDDTDTTLGNIVELLSKLFGIKAGFHGFLHNTLAQVCLDYHFINEVHMEAWTKVITESKPPVPNTPLSPYMESFML
ncbi:hypothetical protein M422DRAFT_211199, partial [Sphaerobolus stellatus SS14]